MGARIVVFPNQGVTNLKARDGWNWHRVSGNKITVSARGFNARKNAVAAAKADIKAVWREARVAADLTFQQTAHPTIPLAVILKWGIRDAA